MSVNEDVKFLQDFERRLYRQIESVFDADFDAAEAVAVRVKNRLEGLANFLDAPLLLPIFLFPFTLGLATLSSMYMVVQELRNLNFFYVFLGPGSYLIFWLIYRLQSRVTAGMDVAKNVLRGCERLAASRDYSPVEMLELTMADASARSVRDVLANRAQEFRVFHLWFFRGAKGRAESELEQREREDALKALHAVNLS